MKIVSVHYKGSAGYEEVCQFAKEIYKERLKFNLSCFPEIVFSINDQDQKKIVGCMGLNTSIRTPLIVRNPKFNWLVQDQSIAEQSVLAIDGYSHGLFVLIAIAARYAYCLGFKKIVFMGIDVSMRTIKHLNFSLVELGNVEDHVLLPEERPNYAGWFSMNKPVVCLGEIEPSLSGIDNILRQFNRRVIFSENLQIFEE